MLFNKVSAIAFYQISDSYKFLEYFFVGTNRFSRVGKILIEAFNISRKEGACLIRIVANRYYIIKRNVHPR